MPDWKILITDDLEKNGVEILRKAAEVDLRPGISSEELLQVVGDYDALIVRGRTKVNQAVWPQRTCIM
jgi:D-3-phosphoglycerate dehydrogenase